MTINWKLVRRISCFGLLLLVGLVIYFAIQLQASIHRAYAPNLLGEYQVSLSTTQTVTARVEHNRFPETILQLDLPPEVKSEEEGEAWLEGVAIMADLMEGDRLVAPLELVQSKDRNTSTELLGQIRSDRPNVYYATWRYRDVNYERRWSGYLSSVRLRLRHDSKELTGPLTIKVIGYWYTTGFWPQ